MKKTMRVLAKSHAKPGIWLTDAPVPAIGHNDVLIQINKTSICGTDLHLYQWNAWAQKTLTTPMILGHEYVGKIVAIGQEVQGFSVGDRVSGEGHVTCQFCRNCRAGRRHLCRNTVSVGVNRAGAFAQYLAIPARNAFKVPDDISDDLVAIFDPLGNAVHTALSFPVVGEDVLVTGAGPIGIMAAAICRHIGARHVVMTDIHPYRLQLATQFGVTRALDVSGAISADEITGQLAQVMRELGIIEAFDIGLETSGNPVAINSLLASMNTGGRIAALGISDRDVTIDWDRLVLSGLLLKGIYGREMFETWYQMVALLQSGLQLDALITHQFPMADYQQAFDLMLTGQCGKVILNW